MIPTATVRSYLVGRVPSLAAGSVNRWCPRRDCLPYKGPCDVVDKIQRYKIYTAKMQRDLKVLGTLGSIFIPAVHHGKPFGARALPTS